MWPAVWTAFVLIFTLSAAAYDVPTILGGGRVLTISQIIFEEQTVVYNQQVASALSVTLVILVLVCLALSQGLTMIRISRHRRVGST
jgi:putative spermidine/putrescine transport system permease protein